MTNKMNWSGPHALNGKTLRRLAQLPGVYVLGFRGSLGTFLPTYVGRSDGPASARLQDHLRENETHGSLREVGSDLFYIQYVRNQQTGFELESAVYHELGGSGGELFNDVHPAAPPRSAPCRVCSGAPVVLPPAQPHGSLNGSSIDAIGTPIFAPPLFAPPPLTSAAERGATIVREVASSLLQDLLAPSRQRGPKH